MATPTVRPLFVILVSLLAITGPGRTALAQESTSGPLAEELVDLMEELQIEAVAGRDPAVDDRFLAAMLTSDRLLVVSARYSSPGTAQVKISNREFQEVYTDLDTTAVAGTKSACRRLFSAAPRYSSSNSLEMTSDSACVSNPSSISSS